MELKQVLDIMELATKHEFGNGVLNRAEFEGELTQKETILIRKAIKTFIQDYVFPEHRQLSDNESQLFYEKLEVLTSEIDKTLDKEK